MSNHNLLLMDFKVPPVWPPSSNWSPTPPPSFPPPPTTFLPQDIHMSCCLTQGFGGSPPSFNSDLYPNITSERCPLNISLALFMSPYPTTSITFNHRELYFILTRVFIVSTKVSECKFSKGSDLNLGAHCCAPLSGLFATIYWINKQHPHIMAFTHLPGPQTRPFHPKTKIPRVMLSTRGWQTTACGPNSVCKLKMGFTGVHFSVIWLWKTSALN